MNRLVVRAGFNFGVTFFKENVRKGKKVVQNVQKGKNVGKKVVQER